MNGYILLDDGTTFAGKLVGAMKPTLGELVFNTSMTGYQEILTDPSYHRQIVVLTHPEIGNYGCHADSIESKIGHAAGMVFRQISPGTWHRDHKETFSDFIARLGLTAIHEVDTRKLTQIIREKGNQNAILAPAAYPLERAKADLAAAPSMAGASLAPEVSVTEPVVYGDGPLHIALLDFGIKMATIRQLVAGGCKVTQVPWNSSLASIRALSPDGILLSNGPGDPAAVPGVREGIAELMRDYPVMGICLGFQLMALALGGETYKLPFGHRGGNHPVRFQGRVVITSQNHGFAVKPESLDLEMLELTHESLFDHSLEGFRLKHAPVFGIQFHPEAAPGPNDCLDHFDYFLTQVREFKAKQAAGV